MPGVCDWPWDVCHQVCCVDGDYFWNITRGDCASFLFFSFLTMFLKVPVDSSWSSRTFRQNVHQMFGVMYKHIQNLFDLYI